MRGEKAMDPKQALNNLDVAVSELTLTRPQHILLASSVSRLKDLIQEWSELKQQGGERQQIINEIREECKSNPALANVMGNPSCLEAEIKARMKQRPRPIEIVEEARAR